MQLQNNPGQFFIYRHGFTREISLVTLPQKPVVATVVRGHKEGTPAMRLILAISSESLDFKPFDVVLIRLA